MKIIKQGKTLEQLDEESRTIECKKCGCIYVYDIKDLTTSIGRRRESLPWMMGGGLRKAVYDVTNKISICPCCNNSITIDSSSEFLYEEEF